MSENSAQMIIESINKKIDNLHIELENKMNLGFSMVDHKVSSLQEFYASKSTYRFA